MFKCAYCGTVKENNGRFRTYCTKSCANRDRVHVIKPRLDYKKIYELYDSGVKRKEIAEIVECSRSSVDRVLKGRAKK